MPNRRTVHIFRNGDLAGMLGPGGWTTKVSLLVGTETGIYRNSLILTKRNVRNNHFRIKFEGRRRDCLLEPGCHDQ